MIGNPTNSRRESFRKAQAAARKHDSLEILAMAERVIEKQMRERARIAIDRQAIRLTDQL